MKKTYAIEDKEDEEDKKDFSEEALKIDIDLVKKYKNNKEKLLSFRKLLREYCGQLCLSKKMEFSNYEELITLIDNYVENVPIYTNIYETIDGLVLRKVIR